MNGILNGVLSGTQYRIRYGSLKVLARSEVASYRKSMERSLGGAR